MFESRCHTSVLYALRNQLNRCYTSFRLSLLVILAVPVFGLFQLASASDTKIEFGESTHYPEQRITFQQALDALRAEDARFPALLAELKDYPLYDYLEFEALRRQIRANEPSREMVDKINQFEQRTGHDSQSRRLTRTLQRRFADTGQWDRFLSIRGSRFAAEMPCTTLRAKWEQGTLSTFTEEVLAIWVQPKTQPEVCQSVLENIERNNTPPVSAIWEKIYQAMEADKPRFAEPMLGYLATKDRKQVQRWIAAYGDPESFLNSQYLQEDTVLNRRIVADLVVHWSRQDTTAAMNHWLKARQNYLFYNDRYYDTHRAIAMRSAYRRMPEAYSWLYTFTARADDLELQEWRIRTALLAEDWSAVLRSIDELPLKEQKEDHWAYWQARALEILGQADLAKAIYVELSELQSYHGFLAADRINTPYNLYDTAIPVDKALLQQLATEPALLRSREFHYVNLAHESRREWNNWLSGKSQSEYEAAAILAARWGLYDRAIYTAGQTEHKRAISIRFPLLYRPQVASAALQHGIEPSWVFAVMRRESAFIREIRSAAGAVGLMQLMPKTAEYVAGKMGKKRWRGDLTDAGTNIDFGTFYLRHVLNQFDGHQVLATASYNAGPHRVVKWLSDQTIEADIWIDTIPFTETRRYVRAIMAYAAIYDYHLTGQVVPISKKLVTVPSSQDA